VLSALLSGEPSAFQCKAALDRARLRGGLIICAPVYVELCAYPGASQHLVGRFLDETGIFVDFTMSEAVWRETALRFLRYANRRRKSGGTSPKRMLVDFVVGSHALLTTDRFLTLDQERYVRDFPELKLL
jgi:predicted nucleic acid-binding protein